MVLERLVLGLTVMSRDCCWVSPHSPVTPWGQPSVYKWLRFGKVKFELGNASCPYPIWGSHYALCLWLFCLPFPFDLESPHLSPATSKLKSSDCSSPGFPFIRECIVWAHVDQHDSHIASCNFLKAGAMTSFLGSPIGHKKGSVADRNTDNATWLPGLRQCPSINIRFFLPSPIFLPVGLSCLTKISAKCSFSVNYLINTLHYIRVTHDNP